MNVNKEIEIILNRYWGIDKIDKIRIIPYGVINSNYIIKSISSSYVFKIYNLRSFDEVSFELSILEYLEGKNFPCPRIVKGAEQNGLFAYHEKPCVLLEFIPGEMLIDADIETMRSIGRLTGRLHDLLKDFEQKIKRPSWEPDDIRKYINSEKDNIVKKNYPGAEKFVSFISNEFEKINFPENLPVGMTHQDVKPENIIIDEKGNISFLDFNDCYAGVLLYDCMTMIIWSCFREGVLQENIFRSYIEGYTDVRKFTQNEKNFLYDALLFRLLRETFVWPMRFSPEASVGQSNYFLKSYRNVKANEKRYRKLMNSI